MLTRRPTPIVAAIVVLSVLLGACRSSDVELKSAAVPKADAAPKAQWVDNRLEVNVPVPVMTFGLSVEEAAALAQALDTHTVDHSVGDINQVISTDTEEPADDPTALLPLMGESMPHPVLPTAIYEVKAAPDKLVAEFRKALETAKLSDTRFDALVMEDFLAAALPKHGFKLNPNAPSMVVVHLEAFGVSTHGWKIQGDTGFLEPVRLFGDRHPLLVLDPSAEDEPYDATSGGYRNPVTADNAPIIANYVREATEFRVLQGSIYPVAQAACHAVTAIMGVKATSLSQLPVGVFRPFEEAFRPDVIKAAFDNLTGTDVFLDVKILSLPADDPVLDAISRAEFPAFEVMRGYLTAMWDSYHVDHPGCEEYLSVVFVGDAAAVPGGGVLGIGTYDDNPGKRISMSWVHDAFRFLLDPESPGCAVGSQVFSPYYCEGKDYLNWWEYLISHESGHILGQRHPHDVSTASGGTRTSDSFSSIWSSMSYQQDGRMIDFGANDRANWQRNRAGFAFYIAAQNGREGTPEWNEALEAADKLDWFGVWQAFNP
ncbi:MAG: hypothetical protein AABY95_00010 [Pseudomonadota bacterium]